MNISAHSHYDEVRFYKDQKGNITVPSFINPSLTTFSSYNPSFRVFEFREQKFYDYYQYRFDMNYHNKLAL